MLREIVLDTETTGMDPADGHRIIEIGCVELVNHLPTGKTFHQYINPEREVDAGAVAVHGIKTEFLKDKPTFAEIVAPFMDFCEGATMVIHNAEFDVKFLNAELKPFGYKPIKLTEVVDTLLMARKKFPGSPANLDALCRRFGVDLSARELHGALLDAQLLADVYLELLGGRQHGLGLGQEKTIQAEDGAQVYIKSKKDRPYREPRIFPPSEEELGEHKKMVAGLKESLW
ncbi:MAG TPA: DNA polymerase III subunit epsilon [Alphaproteobacteria bacterium]|nr:DNA polymerase III subunit epsilon [Alphaproteobacteria bacterium]HNS43797.1 DNA polymerase III subunit epsilon [Alphaproteobacteria bacterium]